MLSSRRCFPRPGLRALVLALPLASSLALQGPPALAADASPGPGALVPGVSAKPRGDGWVFADERGMTVIPPYDHPHIIAGQGTTALELLEQVPELDALVMPIGGGGLIGGCAVAAKGLRPQLRVFGVETEGADDARQSLERGVRVTIAPPTTIADGIRTTAPGVLTFPIMQRHVEQVLVVSDAATLDALRLLLLRLKLVVEPTGAVPLAAVLGGLLPPECRRVGVILSGGNLDPSLLTALW